MYVPRSTSTSTKYKYTNIYTYEYVHDIPYLPYIQLYIYQYIRYIHIYFANIFLFSLFS